MIGKDDPKKRVQALMSRPENLKCADCLSKDPRWASSTLGIFLCINCSGRHRNLGTHITFVRSCTLDSWTNEQADLMERVGNQRANAYWEANLPSDYPRPNTEDLDGLTKFIRLKYEIKKWADKNSDPPNVEPSSSRPAKKKKKIHHSESQGGMATVGDNQFKRSNSADQINPPEPFYPQQSVVASQSSPDDLFSLLGNPSTSQKNFQQGQSHQTSNSQNSIKAFQPQPPFQGSFQPIQQQGSFQPIQQQGYGQNLAQPPPQDNYRNSIKSMLNSTPSTTPNLFGNTAAFRNGSSPRPVNLPQTTNFYQAPQSNSAHNFQSAPIQTGIKPSPIAPERTILRGPNAPNQNRSKDPFSNISPF